MYIIHVYNLFSYPITHCETWLIILFFHLKSLFRNLSYQSHSKYYEYKWSVLIPINIHHHTLGITSLVFYTFPLIIFVYEESVVCWRYYFYLNGFRADTLDNLVKKVWWFVVIYCFTDICTTQNNRCIVFIYKKNPVCNHALQTQNRNNVQHYNKCLRVFFFLCNQRYEAFLF